MSDSFEAFVNQANEAAESGDWQETLRCLQKADGLQPGDPGVLNGLGSCYLELGQPLEAQAYFVQVAQLLPDNADAQNNLGLVYQLNQQYQNAIGAFQKAVQADPAHWTAWKNMASVYLRLEQWEQGVPVLASIIRSNPHDIDAKYLLAQCYEIGEDYGSARLLYEAILIETPDHPEAQAALANLPEASSSGRPVLSMEGAPRTAIYAPPGMPGELRMEMVAVALGSQAGSSVHLLQRFSPEDIQSFDYFIFSQPNISPDWLGAVQACIEAGKPYGLDMEQDYFSIPAGHPVYDLVGPGNPAALKALEVILHDAAWVSVSSPVLAERMSQYARDVRLNLPTWDRKSPLWQADAVEHTTLNIGWIGSPSDFEDMASVRDELMRFMRANPQAKIVVAGDDGVYRRFASLPEKQRQILPFNSVKDVPQIMRQLDILLVPWQDNSFNRAKSDQALLEAGICGVPWIASPIPAYRDWEVGGLFAEKEGDWFAALTRLAGDPELRKNLGGQGRAQADRR